MDYTFKKSTCERYDIRFRGDWAIITISENGGLFNCHSSYGNFSYSWPHHGRESFKHFIVELVRDKSYLLDKVSKKEFDFDATIKKWQGIIIDKRKAGYCKKEDAREAFDLLTKTAGEYCSESELWEIVDENDAFYEATIEYPELGVARTYPHSAHVFADEIMQIFAEIIKAELGEDKTK